MCISFEKMSPMWTIVLLPFAQFIYCHAAVVAAGDIEILDPNDGQLIFANTVSNLQVLST